MMPDRETLIHAIELRESIAKRDHHGFVDFTYEMVGDVLALLKDQKEKEIPKQIIHGQMEEYWGEEEICPDCGKVWQSADIDTTNYCPGCGRRVYWSNE